MEIKTTQKTKKRGIFAGVGTSVKESINRENGGLGTFGMWINLATLAIGFLFGGCHLVFGSYPLGLALISALPVSVWLATLGVIVGSLTLGRSGIIYSLICVLGVFLRVIISGNDKPREKDSDGHTLFKEGLALRISSAVIAGFVAGIYEILLEGFSLETILFGVSMVVLPAVFTLLFAGAFCHGVGVKSLIFGNKACFEEREDKKENLRGVYFRISLLCFIAITAISLKKYNFFGIDLSFVFASVITLFAAKRFGALYGTVVGFVSSAFVSGLFSPAFALAGAGSGALFPFGAWYAVMLGGILLSLWGGYVSGVSGFLSLLPEFIIASCIIFPIQRYFEREKSPEVKDATLRRATDMVGTMALAYRNRQALFPEGIEDAMRSLAPVVEDFCHGEALTENYSAFYKLLYDAKGRTLAKRELDEELTDVLEKIFMEFGFAGGVIRAFGDRRKYIICSGKDRDGTLITSPELIKRFEEASGLKLSTPEYYRRDDMVLMECEAVAKYKLDSGSAKENGLGDEISGDSIKRFKSKELFAYGLICDGMGSGNEAKNASEFASEFLKLSLGEDASQTTVVHMLNGALQQGKEECGVAIDLFALDMITGEGKFIKSGAAASYIKRKNSLFRIKSETMPLGLIKKVDAEKISANVCEDDYIIMLSDGIADPAEDSPWLIEVLNKPVLTDLDEYAAFILSEAKKNSKGIDDMSVLVMRVGLEE